MARFLFWLCAFGATYSYFWYPILLLAFPRRDQKHSGNGASIKPKHIAIVIAARNEARNIAAKVENCLALEHPDLTVEIIVASDASDDATDDITRKYAPYGVRLVRSDTRRGKEYVQGMAAEGTNAELLIFTDASVRLLPDTLTRVVVAFEDKSVGAVSSIDQIVSDQGVSQGEGAYVRYEMWLRDLETKFYSLVGLSGSFFIARRGVCINWDSRVPSDFGVAINCARAGLRAVSDRSIIGQYKTVATTGQEYLRKLRTVNRGMNGLLLRRQVLNILTYPRFAFEVISHKLLRWAAPWFLLGVFATSVVLAIYSPLYRMLLAAQFLFYLLPLACKLVPRISRFRPIALAVFFVQTNAAILHAAALTVSGRSIAFWEPSIR